MKLLFKKRDHPFVYSGYYLWLQKWWALRMGRLVSGLSKTQLIFLLTVFVVLSTGYLIYGIYSAFSGKGDPITVAAVISKVKIKIINEKEK